ncbi:hypothetical protein [Halopiger goleimassiliensis]|uniref:hypothetical protein n=1 Tax=Halopiger goleimassiliensis TaxID=1293048 RepID=UPI0018A85E84|nr:hypothetical protein [Halopiger goleimassiliensis]
MSSDGWRPPIDGVTDRWRLLLGGVADRWRGLERDCQSVLVGATILGLVGLLDVPIPW